MLSVHVLFVVHLAATLALAGIIWLSQVVNYPQYRLVGPATLPAFIRMRLVRLLFITGPLMLAELGTALALVANPPPGVSPEGWAWGLALLAPIWLSTAIFQAPQHIRLLKGFEPGLWRRLVLTNWIRTVGWTARALLVLALTLEMVR
ncbi:MAG: hypothetical protein IT323_04860 [Anaerolineae bacterium]|nr:hypothetical protein [Anaerolineae bacterium]